MALTDKSSVVIPKGFYGKANVLQGFNPQTENLVDLDVVRNTTATRVNEQGLIESVAANVPRRDFLNGGCGELLMEPQRTNLLTYSEDLTLSGYTGTATISASGEIDPRGNTNAEQVTDNSNTVRQEIENILTFTAGANHIQTFYVLKDSNTSRFPEFVLRIFGSGTESSIYMGLNTQTGAKVDRLQNGDSSSKVESIGNYWKVTLQARDFNDGSTDITSQIRPAFGTTIGVSNVAAQGSVVYFGNQLEIGEYESSYIPTSGSTVTRNQDVISATNIGSLLNDAEGGVYINSTVFSDQEFNTFYLQDTSQDNYLEFEFRPNNQSRLKLKADGTNYATGLYVNSYNVGVFNKTGYTYRSNNDVVICKNGVKEIDENIARNAFSSILSKFQLSDNNRPFYGRIREIIVFNNALTDSELQTLTTP